MRALLQNILAQEMSDFCQEFLWTGAEFVKILISTMLLSAVMQSNDTAFIFSKPKSKLFIPLSFTDSSELIAQVIGSSLLRQKCIRE